ncbi:hypothetical protein HC891_17715 [Candidatus Gracilibacteria bacterium]|nr:hypothetical protein [Candidatus Gracilibacteria bacterium]
MLPTLSGVKLLPPIVSVTPCGAPLVHSATTVIDVSAAPPRGPRTVTSPVLGSRPLLTSPSTTASGAGAPSQPGANASATVSRYGPRVVP